MRRFRLLVSAPANVSAAVLAALFLASACNESTSAGGAEKAAPVAAAPQEPEVEVSDAPDMPKQTALTEAGAGTTLGVTLKRGNESWGNGGGTPTWEVTLTVTNYEARAQALGEAMSVIEVPDDGGDTAGLFIYRAGKTPSPQFKQFQLRYGLAWGTDVGPDERKPWPWGAATTMDRSDAFMTLLSAPWAKGLSTGGYPAVKGKSSYVFEEKIMAPLGLKKRPNIVVVVPPRLKNSARVWAQPYFEFRKSPDKEEFAASGQGVLEATEAALKPVIADTTAPIWKRQLALNFLAESFPQSAPADLQAIATDEAAPEKLRFSAILNLGVAQYKPAVAPLLQLMEASKDVRMKSVVVEAMGEMGGPEAAGAVRAAIDSKDKDLRDIAVSGAAKLKDAEAAPKIIALFKATKNEDDQSFYLEALGKIASPDAMETLVAAVSNRKVKFLARREAMLAIGDAKYAGGEAALIDVIRNDPDEGMKGNAIDALGSFSSDTAFAVLKELAASRNESRASSAAEELARSDQPAWRAVALEMVMDPKKQYFASSLIYNLGDVKAAEALPALRAFLADEKREIDDRQSALRAIKSIAGKLSDEDLAVMWTAFTKQKDEYKAQGLADTLIEAGFSDKSVIPFLVGGLDETKNPGWFANVHLLRHLTGQTFGPENSYDGTKASNRAEFDKWRAWLATQPS